MELKRQPTININVIKNLTAPDNLELEIRRRQYFKNGGSIACPQCRDDGIKEPDVYVGCVVALERQVNT